jgi:transposase-like protein
MVRKMLPPMLVSATALSKKSGVAQATLSKWLREARRMDRVRSSALDLMCCARTEPGREEKNPALYARCSAALMRASAHSRLAWAAAFD